MSKWSKRLLSLAAIGGAARRSGLLSEKIRPPAEDDFEDEIEDEDFDLDNDLKPVTDREYVPLNTVSKTSDTADTLKDAAKDIAEDAADAAKDIAEDTVDAAKDIAGMCLTPQKIRPKIYPTLLRHPQRCRIRITDRDKEAAFS